MRGRDEMDCNELVELVTAFLDDALDPETRARVEAHLADCEGCANYVQQFRQTVRTVGKISDDELDPAFRNRLLDAFKNFR
jgi:anti-sigma factor RsiW